MKTRKLILAVSLFGLMAQAYNIFAADTIGYIRVIKGDAYLTQNGKDTKAAMDSPVTQGSLIKTDVGASLGITFKDNTVMALGPATEISIDDYAYSPRQGSFKLDATLSKGTLAYLSGAIAKQNPDGVMLKTPTGKVGVRGSHFAIKVDE